MTSVLDATTSNATTSNANAKWAMVTEYPMMNVISPYWMTTKEQANEFIAYFHYKNKEKVWIQQEGSDERFYYMPNEDKEKENKIRMRLTDNNL